MAARLWFQFISLLVGLQWVLGALLVLLFHLGETRAAGVIAAVVMLALLWRIGLVFRGECRRLQVAPALRAAEALLASIVTAVPTLAAAALHPHAPALRWLVGPLAQGGQILASLAHGPALDWVLLPLLALLCFFVPAGLLKAPPAEPLIKTQPVALEPAVKPPVHEQAPVAVADESVWKPARRHRDVTAGRERPGRLPPTVKDLDEQ